MVYACELMTVGSKLRLTIFGLACALGVEFDSAEVERVFTDCVTDQISEKAYLFWDARNVRVTGKVEESEPGTIWIHVHSKQALVPPLRSIVERVEELIHRAEGTIPS
jgi:hypothetical protein